MNFAFSFNSAEFLNKPVLKTLLELDFLCKIPLATISIVGNVLGSRYFKKPDLDRRSLGAAVDAGVSAIVFNVLQSSDHFQQKYSPIILLRLGVSIP